MNKILCSGVAGFLGSHLSEMLLRNGHTVIGIDNLLGGDLSNIPSGVEFHRLDCNNVNALKLLMKDVDIVYHLACTPHEGLSVFSPYENVVHGYSATAAMVTAAISCKVKKFIFTTSMARYGKGPKSDKFIPFTEDMPTAPVDPYGLGKVAAEDLLKLMSSIHDMKYSIAVPHNIIGIKQRFWDPFRNVASIMINLMLQGRQPIIYGDGEQKRCFSYYTDCIEPLIKMGFDDNCNSEIINIGPDDEFVSINQLAIMLADLIGFDLKPQYVLDRPQEVRLATCNANKARKLLDYEPKVKLIDGLQEMVEWIKKRGPRPFDYHLDLEIVNDKTPLTWKNRLF